MRVLLIGATGRTGILVLSELLERGHSVTALVRDPSKLSHQTSTTPEPTLTVVRGSPTSSDDVSRALASTSDMAAAVIVTLNAPRASDSPFAKPIGPANLLRDASRAVTGAMRAHGVGRLVSMSAFGVGDSNDTISCLLRQVLRRTNMAAQFADHDEVDRELKDGTTGKGLDWVLVRPVMLGEGPKAAVKDLGDLGEGAGMLSKVSRASVAGFLVDCAEGEKFVARTPVISN